MRLTALALTGLFVTSLFAAFSTGCGKAEEEIEAVIGNPNNTQTVATLVGSAGTLLEQAIAEAEKGILKVLVVDPNSGTVTDKDIAAELKAVKADLEKVLP